jgi:hypothetical protein
MVVAPQAEVVHYWDQSPLEEKGRMMEESFKKFMLKHYGKIPELILPVPPENYPEDCSDLGEISSSTTFSLENAETGDKLFFDFGLNPQFVPFAQAEMVQGYFQFPQKILDRINPGEYYSRVRNSLNKTLKIWKWKKF